MNRITALSADDGMGSKAIGTWWSICRVVAPVNNWCRPSRQDRSAREARETQWTENDWRGFGDDFGGLKPSPDQFAWL